MNSETKHSGPVDVLAVMDEAVCALQNDGNDQEASDLIAATAAVDELIEALHKRRMEIGRRGGNTINSHYREEWEFLGDALATVGSAP